MSHLSAISLSLSVMGVLLSLFKFGSLATKAFLLFPTSICWLRGILRMLRSCNFCNVCSDSMESHSEREELLKLRTKSSVKTRLVSKSFGTAAMGLLAAIRRCRLGKAELSFAISSHCSIWLSLKWRFLSPSCLKVSLKSTVL